MDSMNDVVVQLLQKAGVPVTRENYLNMAYLGNPPKKLTAEEEAELPRELREWGENVYFD